MERAKGEVETKLVLLDGLKEIVKSSLEQVNKQDTVDILNWGLQQKFLDLENAKVSDYGAIIPMMFASLEGTAHYEKVKGLKG